MDHLDHLAQDTLERLAAGYYANVTPITAAGEKRSFVEAIGRAQVQRKNAVIAEIKPASPSEGQLLGPRDLNNLKGLMEGLREAGAAGLSVLTDPKNFGGSLESLKIASGLGLPTLMKDFVLDPVQLDACRACGGSAVLLIFALFRRGYAQCSLQEMIEEAHRRGLEVLLEVSCREEYEEALSTRAEMIGINNRDLTRLRVDLRTTERILRGARKDRPVWALSGIESPEDLFRLREAGADAFLVGTALMRAQDPIEKLRGLIAS